ncbi:hypothetical protein ABTN79_19255, partial [Acinetobacter baumannii]
GLPQLAIESVMAGTDLLENANLLRQAVSEVDSPRSMAVVPNAASALVLAGLASDIREGAELARTVVANGRAAAKLDQFISATQKEDTP